ncbi:MAG: hypothetical protein WD826_06835 [Actinomycetota bacterium]
MGGPDVWEIGRLFRDLDLTGEELLRVVADQMDLELFRVRVAERYYRAYRSEIDAWIDENDREADEAYETWLAAST